MLWIVDTPQRSVIVAARSAEAARAGLWQEVTGVKFASHEEIRQHGDVVFIADAVAPAEDELLRRLLER